MRWIADSELDDPAEAVRSYHAGLEKAGVQPYRALEEDIVPTRRDLAYGGARGSGGGRSSQAVVQGAKPAAAAASSSGASRTPSRDGEPDFANMTNAEKVQWNLDRWKRVLG